MIKFRQARAIDADAISQVLGRSYSVAFPTAYEPEVCDAVLPLTTRASPSLIASGTYYVATENDVICGCGGWSHEDPSTKVATPGTGHIRHFATDPDWGRRGVGRGLFDRCVETARNADIKRFQCLSALNAEPFYRGLGFTRISVETPLIGPDAFPFPSVRMMVDLG